MRNVVYVNSIPHDCSIFARNSIVLLKQSPLLKHTAIFHTFLNVHTPTIHLLTLFYITQVSLRFRALPRQSIIHICILYAGGWLFCWGLHHQYISHVYQQLPSIFRVTSHQYSRRFSILMWIISQRHLIALGTLCLSLSDTQRAIITITPNRLLCPALYTEISLSHSS